MREAQRAGLVRHDHVHALQARARCGHEFREEIRHHLDGQAEDGLAIHAEQVVARFAAIARVALGAAAADFAVAPPFRIRAHLVGADAGAAVAPLDDDGGGAVAKDHRRFRLAPVDAARGQVGRDDGDAPVGAVRQHRGGHAEGGHETEAAGVDVEAWRAGRQSRVFRDKTGRVRQGLLGHAAGADQQIDVGRAQAGVLQRVAQGGGAQLALRLVGRRDKARQHAALAQRIAGRMAQCQVQACGGDAVRRYGFTRRDQANWNHVSFYQLVRSRAKVAGCHLPRGAMCGLRCALRRRTVARLGHNSHRLAMVASGEVNRVPTAANRHRSSCRNWHRHRALPSGTWDRYA